MKNYLLMGRTGVGKSSFINCAFGESLAGVDPYRSCTKVVKLYDTSSAHGSVCIIDTPGLAEDDKALDELYLSDVADKIKDVSIEAFLYITPLTETRFRAEEQESLVTITNHLGSAIWASSWLVFTFAASIPDEKRTEIVNHRLQEFHALLTRIAKPKGINRGYSGFVNVLLVDNVSSNWSPNCLPILSFLG